jgi:thioredoxin-like negative regulator of GroEL
MHVHLSCHLAERQTIRQHPPRRHLLSLIELRSPAHPLAASCRRATAVGSTLHDPLALVLG